MIITESKLQNETVEFVTIVGGSAEDIAAEFRAQGLAEQDYSIVNRVGRHRFTVVGDQSRAPQLEGQPLMAATFQRRVHS